MVVSFVPNTLYLGDLFFRTNKVTITTMAPPVTSSNNRMTITTTAEMIAVLLTPAAVERVVEKVEVVAEVGCDAVVDVDMSVA